MWDMRAQVDLNLNLLVPFYYFWVYIQVNIYSIPYKCKIQKFQSKKEFNMTKITKKRQIPGYIKLTFQNCKVK